MSQVGSRKMTLRVADDVRHTLEKWAQENLSTMTHELNACIREKAQLERWERVSSASAAR
jgi:hypothetical protein